MTVDYIVASLPALSFGAPAPISWDAFLAACGDKAGRVEAALSGGRWRDLETQLRNAAAEARGGEDRKRPAEGASVYWRERMLACFRETDVLARENLIDRTWWDAAGELAAPSDPLGFGALAAYAARLKIALRRTAVSAEAGAAAFDALTAATRGNISI